MKNIIFILLNILILAGCNRNKNINSTSSNIPKKAVNIQVSTLEDSIKRLLRISDSIKVLVYENHPNWFEYIFIDYSKNSPLYEKLEKRFNLGEFEFENIYKQLNEFKNRTSDSVKHLLKNEYQYLLGKWICLYQLDDEFFVSNTCDFEGYFILTDTLFYDCFTMDGPDLSIFNSASKISDVKTQFAIETLRGVKDTVDFYQINNSMTFLVVFNNKFGRGNHFITYMTNSKNIRNYNLVHHECSELDRYKFDVPDYDEILLKLNK